MIVVYNRDELEKALSDFHLATGANISLVDADMNCISSSHNRISGFCRLIHSVENGEKRCQKSDCVMTGKCAQSGKLEIHTCHAGLVDSAVPIKYNNSIIAFIILGQMKNEKSFDEIKHLSADLNLDEKSWKRLIKICLYMTRKKYKALQTLLHILQNI